MSKKLESNFDRYSQQARLELGKSFLKISEYLTNALFFGMLLGPLLWIYTSINQIGYDATAQKLANFTTWYRLHVVKNPIVLCVSLILFVAAFLIFMYIRNEGLKHIDMATKSKHQPFASKLRSRSCWPLFQTSNFDVEFNNNDRLH